MNIKEITSIYKPFNTVGHKMSNTMKVLIKAAIKTMKESKKEFGTGLAHTVMSKGNSLSICYADDFPDKDIYFTAINMMRREIMPTGRPIFMRSASNLFISNSGTLHDLPTFSACGNLFCKINARICCGFI